MRHIGDSESMQKQYIQELMLLTVEKRSKQIRTSREIEFLTDRRSIYRTKETIQFSRSLSPKSCFTMVYRPVA